MFKTSPQLRNISLAAAILLGTSLIVSKRPTSDEAALHTAVNSDPVLSAPAAATPPALNAVPTPAPATGSDGSLPIAKAAATPPAPLKTRKDLNALADGPLPLTQKVAELAAIMRGSDVAFGAEAAKRAVFLVDRTNYVQHLRPLILDETVSLQARGVLAHNLYDRPFEISLPVWAAISQVPNHPMAQEATDGLVFHLKDKGLLKGAPLDAVIKEFLAK